MAPETLATSFKPSRHSDRVDSSSLRPFILPAPPNLTSDIFVSVALELVQPVKRNRQRQHTRKTATNTPGLCQS